VSEATLNPTVVDESPLVSRALLEIVAMTKHFGETAALDGVSLNVTPGEFFTIIGPSGSGKTTLLRIIGGFETPDSYERFQLAGLDVADIPAHRRNVATVFQHYALFPHMTVGKNIEYGLKVRGVKPAERRRRAEQALELVRLPQAYAREVGTLSGGERQRIALARAIVTEPALLLLDEPLGALDERLRADMQFELKQLQQSLGMTFIYITHNQDEALTMSDRLAVLHTGRLEQLGTPRDVYERPASRFVAQFMGATNLLEGTLVDVGPDGSARVRVADSVLGGLLGDRESSRDGDRVWLSVRPEHLRAETVEEPTAGKLIGRVAKSAYRGSSVETTFDLSGTGQLTVRDAGSDTAAPVGSLAHLIVDSDKAVVLRT
jgi:ABC-type Fe3+/spermidine/putrescine transport system ATPase subunit